MLRNSELLSKVSADQSRTFFSGPAASGKSFLAKQVVQNLSRQFGRFFGIYVGLRPERESIRKIITDAQIFRQFLWKDATGSEVCWHDAGSPESSLLSHGADLIMGGGYDGWRDVLQVMIKEGFAITIILDDYDLVRQGFSAQFFLSLRKLLDVRVVAASRRELSEIRIANDSEESALWKIFKIAEVPLPTSSEAGEIFRQELRTPEKKISVNILKSMSNVTGNYPGLVCLLAHLVAMLSPLPALQQNEARFRRTLILAARRPEFLEFLKDLWQFLDESERLALCLVALEGRLKIGWPRMLTRWRDVLPHLPEFREADVERGAAALSQRRLLIEKTSPDEWEVSSEAMVKHVVEQPMTERVAKAMGIHLPWRRKFSPRVFFCLWLSGVIAFLLSGFFGLEEYRILFLAPMIIYFLASAKWKEFFSY